MRPLPRPLHILPNEPYDGGIIVQAELPKGSMKSVRCRFGEARPGKRLVLPLRPGGPKLNA